MLRLWDLESGAILRTLLGHRRTPSRVNFLPDGRAMSTTIGETKFWDLGGSRRRLGRYSKIVRDLAYSDDGRWVATAAFDKTVRLYRRGEVPDERILQGHERRVQSVNFSPDSKQLVSASADMTIRVWDVETGECTKTLQHDAMVLRAEFSPGGFISSDTANNVVIWKTDPDEPLYTLPHEQWPSMFVQLPNHELMTTSLDGKARLWDMRTGTLRRSMDIGQRIHSADLAPDGRTMAVASSSRPDLSYRSQGLRIDFVDLESWTIGRTISGVSGILAYNADGSRLAVGLGNTVRVVDPASGRTVLELANDAETQDVEFSPDGAQLATATGWYQGQGCGVILRGRVPGVAWPPKLD